MRSAKTNKKKQMMIAIGIGAVATFGAYGMINSQKSAIENSNQKIAELQNALTSAQQNPAAVAQSAEVNAYTAKIDIKSGDLITKDKVEAIKSLPNDLPPGYISNINMVIGQTASQDILAGKIITSAEIVAEKGSNIDIPDGMRAVTIPREGLNGIPSYVKVGSKIDILTTKNPPQFVVQNVKIIAFEVSADYKAAIEQQSQQTTADAVSAAPPADAAAAPPPAAVPPPTAPAFNPASVTAEDATGITVMVPVKVAQNLLSAISTGKLQVLARGKNDNNIVKSSSYAPISLSSLPKPPSPSTIGGLPPVPIGASSLPNSFPSPVSSTPAEPPKTVEVYEGNSKKPVTFGDTSNGSGSSSGSSSAPAATSSAPVGTLKSIKDLLNF